MNNREWKSGKELRVEVVKIGLAIFCGIAGYFLLKEMGVI